MDEEEMLLRAIALSLKEEELCSIKGELLKKTLFKNKIKDEIAFVFLDDSEMVAGMAGDDEDEEEMLKRAIAISLEEQQ